MAAAPDLPAGLGEVHEHGPPVTGIATAQHQAVALQARDELRDARLGHLFGIGQLRQSHRAPLRQGVEHRQRGERQLLPDRYADVDAVEVLDHRGEPVHVEIIDVVHTSNYIRNLYKLLK